MKIYRKENDVIQLLCYPEEVVKKGEYLLIEDKKLGKGLIVQVIDIQYANIPGILEDILRDVMAEESMNGEEYDPFEISSQITVLKDARLLICKIRGTMENGKPISSFSWIPSRIYSRISNFLVEKAIQTRVELPIKLGYIDSKKELIVDAKALDGKLNIITGKKGTGKSHLSKLLMLSLIDYGAPCIIFDINGEYMNLGLSNDNKENEYKEKILVLTPGKGLKFSIDKIEKKAFLNMLIYGLDLPTNSARVFSRIWNELEKQNRLSLKALNECIQRWNCHESIKDALQSRFESILDSNLFTDDINEAIDFEAVIEKISKGGAIVINLKNKSSMSRRMIVELIINKLVELLSSLKLKAIFLFAEEAHLYLRETYWDDVVTRMRHIGLFTTFITNQPDTIKESIYRQADNIFLFNFMNERDLEAVSRFSKIDAESIKSIVRDLPPYHCLIIGDLVKNFPIVVKVRGLEVKTMGETRLFFSS
jgi:DNA helicase HerA-like ATPase